MDKGKKSKARPAPLNVSCPGNRYRQREFGWRLSSAGATVQQQNRTIVQQADVTFKAILLQKRQQFRRTESYKGPKTTERPPDAIIDFFSQIQEKNE